MTDIGSAGIGAALGGLVTGFVAWLNQRTKSESDVEVAVLAEWQKLYNALSERVSELEKQLAKVRSDHADEIDAMRKRHRAEMTSLRELNEGLQRQIAQNSKSTAAMLSRGPVTHPKEPPDGK
jgi:phosphoenolpyruvate-protein kinase (PTS system EI component)